MKRFLLIPIFLLCLSVAAFSQTASESNEKSPTGGSGNAVVIQLEGQHKNVEDVMKKKFKKLKSKREKGFDAFKGQIFSAISTETLDYYYKVEKKGDKSSRVIIFISKGYDNWITNSDNAGVINNTKKLLDDLVAEVRTYELELAIAAQTKVLEGAMKDQEDLVKDNDKLLKEQKKLEEEMQRNTTEQEENATAQENQAKVIEDEKKVLEELQSSLGKVK